VERLRIAYSLEDKELIEKFLEAKKVFNLKSGNVVRDPKETRQLPGKLGMTYYSLSLSLFLSLIFSLYNLLTAQYTYNRAF
jgi:hypothetical protein